MKWEQVQKEAHTAGLSPGLGTQSSVPARAWLGPARCAEAANNCPGKALQRAFRQGHADILVKGPRHWQQPFFSLSPNRAIFIRKAALL